MERIGRNDSCRAAGRFCTGSWCAATGAAPVLCQTRRNAGSARSPQRAHESERLRRDGCAEVEIVVTNLQGDGRVSDRPHGEQERYADA